jgi:hypothetical protein
MEITTKSDVSKLDKLVLAELTTIMAQCNALDLLKADLEKRVLNQTVDQRPRLKEEIVAFLITQQTLRLRAEVFIHNISDLFRGGRALSCDELKPFLTTLMVQNPEFWEWFNMSAVVRDSGGGIED